MPGIRSRVDEQYLRTRARAQREELHKKNRANGPTSQDDSFSQKLRQWDSGFRREVREWQDFVSSLGGGAQDESNRNDQTTPASPPDGDNNDSPYGPKEEKPKDDDSL